MEEAQDHNVVDNQPTNQGTGLRHLPTAHKPFWCSSNGSLSGYAMQAESCLISLALGGLAIHLTRYAPLGSALSPTLAFRDPAHTRTQAAWCIISLQEQDPTAAPRTTRSGAVYNKSADDDTENPNAAYAGNDNNDTEGYNNGTEGYNNTGSGGKHHRSIQPSLLPPFAKLYLDSASIYGLAVRKGCSR